jgi:hypothetical protein
VGSVYSADNDAVYDGISRPGVRLVSFASILKTQLFPLAELLQEILDLCSRGMAAPVELEFAADPGPVDSARQDFAILQIRPLVVGREEVKLDLHLEDPERVLVFSEHVLGNGRIDEICDIILVRPDRFDRTHTPETALEIRKLNEKMQAEGRPYLLIGPGRWGSRDRWLGIPVVWSDISWARVIVETELSDLKVEPSQGSHFFHNLTSFEVGYFTAHESDAKTQVNWDWLGEQAPVEETQFLRHLRLDRPLEIYLDGRHSRGVVLRPKG